MKWINGYLTGGECIQPAPSGYLKDQGHIRSDGASHDSKQRIVTYQARQDQKKSVGVYNTVQNYVLLDVRPPQATCFI